MPDSYLHTKATLVNTSKHTSLSFSTVWGTILLWEKSPPHPGLEGPICQETCNRQDYVPNKPGCKVCLQRLGGWEEASGFCRETIRPVGRRQEIFCVCVCVQVGEGSAGIQRVFRVRVGSDQNKNGDGWGKPVLCEVNLWPWREREKSGNCKKKTKTGNKGFGQKGSPGRRFEVGSFLCLFAGK